MSLKGAATACPEAPLVVTAGKNATQVDQVDLLENAEKFGRIANVMKTDKRYHHWSRPTTIPLEIMA